jgi:hypothetical protein
MQSTLYVSRPLLNADDLVKWAKEQGFGKTLTADDMHVTVAFSRATVDWEELAADPAPITVNGGDRAVKWLGNKGAAVLRFDSQVLADRWQEFRDAGASWDWPGYQPHVTISYDGADVALEDVEPYDGCLVFGPERFAEIDENWTDKVTEKFKKSTFAAPAAATDGLQNYDLEGARARRRARRKRKTAGESVTKESTMDLKLFIPLTKIDAAKRLVYGVATAEKPDVVGEVCDYESTKPLYQKWSEGFSKATDGKSLGNLRVMHGPVAAGKVTELAFNDDAKQIEICAKVVDDAEWTKVEEGVYTGFSQGGRYLKRWKAGGHTRYTAEPIEISLVDNPCLPEATFSVIKTDGSTELRKFTKTDPAARAERKAAAHRDRAEEHDDAAKRAAAGSAEEKAHGAARDENKEAADLHGAAAAQYKAGDSDAGDRLSAKADEQSDVANAASQDANKAAPIGNLGKGGDGDWEQVWVSKRRLPGKDFKTKAALRQALIDLDAEEAAKKQAAPVLEALAGVKDKLAKAEGGDAAAAAGKTDPQAGDGNAGKVNKSGQGDDAAIFAAMGVKDATELRRLLIALPSAAAAKLSVDVAKRTYSDEERNKYAKQGVAMKDGSYPIPDKDALEDAIHAFGRAKNKAATKRHIIKRAKALGAADMLPEDWSGSTKNKEESKKLAGDGKLAKNLYFIGNLVQLLASLECSEDDYEIITRWGSDDPERKQLCDRFGEVLTDFADLVADILDRAITHIGEEEKGEADGTIERARLFADLIKIGARNSKADKAKIKQMHDLCVELDEDCCDGADDDENDDDAEKMIKALQSERDAERKAFEKQLGDIMALVKQIADQPLPMGTSSVSLRVVDKTVDSPDFGKLAEQLDGASTGDDGLVRLADAAQRHARAHR